MFNKEKDIWLKGEEIDISNESVQSCEKESEKFIDKEEALSDLEELKQLEEETKLSLKTHENRLKTFKMISFISDYIFVLGAIYLIMKFGTHNRIMNFLYIAYLILIAFLHYFKNKLLKNTEETLESSKAAIKKEIDDEKERLYAILK